MALPFVAPSRRGNSWFFVGLASQFPNITGSGTVMLSEQQKCLSDDGAMQGTGCKVFIAPDANGESREAIQLSDDPQDQADASLRNGEQVLVFKYAGEFHAIDNKCPHSSYPLSNGSPFDIEDFGVKLSAGITCPKHGWSFDLFTGSGDHGSYKLKLWEVQLRIVTCVNGKEGEQEVWVRKKQRIG